ncbi:MAG TPA: four helix bundle protein [Patescibacteria group bacterium]|jgi:four helix bundle protein|nr:four helix bundle protein [Patescibacteria group bacterium]
MDKIQSTKQYDLEDRTYEFAKRCRDFVVKLAKTQPNVEYGGQLIRSSGSQAANYIEANDAISAKDFLHRIKICRKESKESRLWLRLCEVGAKSESQIAQKELIQEAFELTRIFGSIVEKRKQNHV